MQAQVFNEDVASVLVVDDHKLIRDTWSFILNEHPRLKVIADTDSGREAVDLAVRLKPDIILMDINMSPIDGFETTKIVSKLSPTSKILAVSMYSKPVYAKKIIRMGASGYITKNSSKEEMITATLSLLTGKKFICNEIQSILAKQMLGEDAPDIKALSRREQQIIEYIKEGQCSREIAAELNITLKTVEVHRHNILKKLKVKNTASLVNFINNCFDPHFNTPGEHA